VVVDDPRLGDGREGVDLRGLAGRDAHHVGLRVEALVLEVGVADADAARLLVAWIRVDRVVSGWPVDDRPRRGRRELHRRVGVAVPPVVPAPQPRGHEGEATHRRTRPAREARRRIGRRSDRDGHQWPGVVHRVATGAERLMTQRQ
jgi:hypothetical protein